MVQKQCQMRCHSRIRRQCDARQCYRVLLCALPCHAVLPKRAADAMLPQLPCAMDSLLRSPPDRPRKMMPPGSVPPTCSTAQQPCHDDPTAVTCKDSLPRSTWSSHQDFCQRTQVCRKHNCEQCQSTSVPTVCDKLRATHRHRKSANTFHPQHCAASAV